MAGHKHGQDRQQETFLPSRLDDYVSEDHPCRVIDAFVNQLDLKARGFTKAQPSTVGCPAYAPGDMLKLFLYGFQNHIRSSRRLEVETHRNVEVMWLLKGLTPDARTICYFRSENSKAFKEVFHDFNKLCLQWGLFGRETVAIDGSKIKANNSRRHHYTKENAAKQLSRLEKQITEYFNELEQNDQAEAKEEKLDYSKAAKILEKLNMKKSKLESILAEINESGGNPICTIDRDAALMKQSGGKGFDVCHNVQTAVDEKNGLVVDFNVTNHCNDIKELSDMASRAKEMLEVENLNVLADTGYSSGVEIHKCQTNGVTCYIPKPEPSHQPEDIKYRRENFHYDDKNDQYTCPEGNVMPYVRTRKRDGFMVYANRKACMNCPVKSKCTKSKTLREIERNPYQADVDEASDRAKKRPGLYQRRQELSEHPFGVVKRKWGFDQYLCRGKEKVTGETALVLLAFNFRRVLKILGAKAILEYIAKSISLLKMLPIKLLLSCPLHYSAVYYSPAI